MDIALGALPFEERAVARATRWQPEVGLSLVTCSAEDLIVHKAFAGRDVDWGDIERVLTRQHGKLKFEQVRSELTPLLDLKAAPESREKLELLIAKVDTRLK